MILVIFATFVGAHGLPLDPISALEAKMLLWLARVMTYMNRKKLVAFKTLSSPKPVASTMCDLGHFCLICVCSWATP